MKVPMETRTGAPHGQTYVVADRAALRDAQSFGEILAACKPVFEWDLSSDGQRMLSPGAYCPTCGTVTAKLMSNPRTLREYAECPTCNADLGDAR
jgi:hypothetical protein